MYSTDHLTSEKPSLTLLSGSNITPASLDLLYRQLTGRSMTAEELDYAKTALSHEGS